MNPYDVIFQKDDVFYGYTLAEASGKKMWQVQDISLLPPSMLTGEASYSSYSPQKQIITQQSDWRGGLQDLMYDSATQYYRAINTDARFKGKVILSGKNTDNTITTPYRKIKNPNLKDWDNGNATDWTDNDGAGYSAALATQATGDDAYSHDYAYKLGGDGSDVAQVYQDLPWTNELRGKTLTLKAYCKQEGSFETGVIFINDGVDEDTVAITATSYTQSSIAHVMNGSATRLRIGAESVSATTGDYLYADAFTIEYSTATMAEPTAMKTFEGNAYFGYGKYLFRYDTDGLGVVREFPQNITDLCVFQNPAASGGSNPTYQRLYIAQGVSAKFFYTDDGWTFTISTVEEAKYMAAIGNTVMLISDSTNTIRSSANPINSGTAFSDAYTVGGDYYEITSLCDHPDTWFVRKENQVYYLSGASVIPLIEGLEVEANTDIAYPLLFWQDKLYIPSGENALYEYDITDGTTTTLSPITFAIGDTRYDGIAGRGICADGEFLYITVETESRTLILAGRWETVGGTTDWRWHPIYDASNPSVTPPLMIATVSGIKRLFSGVAQFSGQTAFTSHADSESGWNNEANAYDENLSTAADTNSMARDSWSEALELIVTSTNCTSVAYYSYGLAPRMILELSAYYDSAYTQVYQGAVESKGWHTHDLVSAQDVTKMKVRYYNNTGMTFKGYFVEGALGGTDTWGLKEFMMSKSYADPLIEKGYEIESPGDFITPWYRTAFSTLDKYFQELQVTSKVRNDGEITVYYQLKGDGDPDVSGNWTLLGRCTQNDVITGNYPAEHLDVFPIKKVSERIRFKFVLSSTDDDYSPILYGEGGGIQLVSRIAGKVRQIDMTLMVGDMIPNRSSVAPHRNVSQQIKDLEMLSKSMKMTMTGLDGVERTVIFHPNGLKESPYVIGRNQDEWRIECKLLEAE